jgi:hypothetical protein
MKYLFQFAPNRDTRVPEYSAGYRDAVPVCWWGMKQDAW